MTYSLSFSVSVCYNGSPLPIFHKYPPPLRSNMFRRFSSGALAFQLSPFSCVFPCASVVALLYIRRLPFVYFSPILILSFIHSLVVSLTTFSFPFLSKIKAAQQLHLPIKSSHSLHSTRAESPTHTRFLDSFRLVFQLCLLYHLPSNLGNKCLKKICLLVKFHPPTAGQRGAIVAPCSRFPFRPPALFLIAESRYSDRSPPQIRRIVMPRCRPFLTEWLTKRGR